MRLGLIALLLVSLSAYLFPFDPDPFVATGTRWVYHYREAVLSTGNPAYVYNAEWRYLAVNSFQDIAYIEMNGTSKMGYHSENGSWLEVNGTGSSSFLVDIRTRLFDYGFFSSWWVPANLRLGDFVPIWNLNFRIVGLTWRIVEGWPLECWVLESSIPQETYTFYYERTTGFFVHFAIRRTYGNTETLIERSLIDASFTWPALALVRPFLIPTVIGALVLLLLPFRARLRRPREKPPESTII